MSSCPALLILRTPAQFMAASERETGRWLGEADAVLAIAVFGKLRRRWYEELLEAME